jgi:hypothetical protein
MDSKKCTKRGLCRRLRQDTSQTETTGKLEGVHDGTLHKGTLQNGSLHNGTALQNGIWYKTVPTEWHTYITKNLTKWNSITKRYITENYGLIGHLL